MPHKPTDQDESASKRPSATARALKILAQKGRSRAELTALLEEQAYAPEAVAKALADVSGWGYLNDGRLAEAEQAKAARLGRGTRYLTGRLAGRKLPREVILRLQEHHEREEATLLAALVARRFSAPGALASDKQRAKALRFLLGRGFRPAPALAAIGRAAGHGGQAPLVPAAADEHADAWPPPEDAPA